MHIHYCSNFFFKEINAFIQQECISLIISDSKEIDNVMKYVFYINCSFGLSIHQRILKCIIVSTKN